MRAIPVNPLRNSLSSSATESVAYWVIASRSNSPMVKYTEDKDIIKIEGESTGSKTLPVIEEAADIAQHHLAKHSSLKLVIHIQNTNGYGIMGLMKLFSVLSEANLKGKKVIVKWYWDRRNQENIPDAVNFSRLFNFPFFMIVL
jgi:hypothetical protein